jgi:conserved oligomeric Golgi complex subunit 6
MAVEDSSSMSNPPAAASVHAGHHGSSSSGAGILSDKVSRALQVRTDTIPMRAALDALAGVPSSLVDSRSVRTAIEMDALRQAQLLRQALEERVVVVRTLRKQLRDVAKAAQQVQIAVNTPVIPASSSSSSSSAAASASASPYATLPLAASETTSPDATGSSAASLPSTSSSTLSWLEREQQLAATLSSAFEARNSAKARQEAVEDFLRHYHLSSEDQRLLEHYNFDDVGPLASSATNSSPPANGLAFLRALERLTEIRKELQRAHHHHHQGSGGKSAGGEPAASSATSALRVMERIATQQERGYERLYHWLQSYLTAAASATSTASGGSSSAAGSTPTIGMDDATTDALEEALLWMGGGPQGQQDDAGGGDDDDNDSHRGGQQHARAASGAAASNVTFVQRALHTLRNVPVFYSHLLELVAGSRRTIVTRRFLTALSSGYQGMPPLELQSHDSTLYVGEMLGFCWRTLCVETDIVRGLFPSDDAARGGGANSSMTNEDDDDDDALLRSTEHPMSASDLLSTSMSGVSRPLKSRIMQIITTLSRQAHAARDAGEVDNGSDDGLDEMEEEGVAQRHRIVHLYEICGLLLFYAGAVDMCLQKLPKSPTTVGPDSAPTTEADAAPAGATNPFLQCLHECLEEGTRGYEATIRVYAARLAPLSSMSGESEARLVESLLHLLSSVRTQSPGYSAGVRYPNPETRHLLGMEWSADTLIRGALACCQRLDHVVVLKQALAVAKKAGMGDVVMVQRLDEAIDQTEAVLIEQMVDREAAKVLDLCGLGGLVSSLALWKDDLPDTDANDSRLPMSSAPGLTPEDVESSIKDFYASLYSPPLPSLETAVKDPLLRRTARSKIAARVVDAYDELYRHITTAANEGGEYLDVVNVLGHTPDQVRTLLSV